ncbi:MAG: prepilin-type N-terminal cleavage/methylation domain-containing protein [Ignavibacteria bacterium]|nr:prepilin-type N-terminal cleavage/methylation domain-containing protein [Ignavibacteria bacterium]
MRVKARVRVRVKKRIIERKCYVTFLQSSGFSMIETLVAILLLGIISSLFIIFFNDIFSNPKIFLKGKALNAANEEINYSLAHKSAGDTSYFSENGVLFISREIEIIENIRKVEVKVLFHDQNTELTKLTVEDKFEN